MDLAKIEREFKAAPLPVITEDDGEIIGSALEEEIRIILDPLARWFKDYGDYALALVPTGMVARFAARVAARVAARNPDTAARFYQDMEAFPLRALDEFIPSRLYKIRDEILKAVKEEI